MSLIRGKQASRSTGTGAALAAIPTAVLVAAVEFGRQTATNLPVPFLLLLLAVLTAGYLRGRHAGILAGSLAAGSVAWNAWVGHGPAGLTGGPLQAAFGTLLYLFGGAGVGHLRDQRDQLMRQLRDHQADLEAKVNARTRALEVTSDALRDAGKMQALGRLTAGLAHEVNNLLTPILGGTALLRDAAPITAEPWAAETLERMDAAGRRAADLMQQLLGFARTGANEPNSTVVLQDAVAAAVKLVEGMLPAGISVHTGCDGSAKVVNAQSLELQQVIINLCVNARDAMPSGGTIRLTCSTPRIEGVRHCDSCGAVCDGSWVALAVADSGAGMPKAVREHLFEPFFTTKARGQGTGMGMAMAHGTVHACNGHILVDEGDVGGTVVTLLLPDAAASTAKASKRQDQTLPHADRPPVDLQGARVLVVDDDPAVVATLCAMLANAGAQTDAADSVSQATRHMLQQLPDMLLTDWDLPDGTGADVIAAAQALQPGMPVLICTGIPVAPDRVPPSIPILGKPVSPEELVSAANDQLAARTTADAGANRAAS